MGAPAGQERECWRHGQRPMAWALLGLEKRDHRVSPALSVGTGLACIHLSRDGAGTDEHRGKIVSFYWAQKVSMTEWWLACPQGG